jgi:hypothetical protein
LDTAVLAGKYIDLIALKSQGQDTSGLMTAKELEEAHRECPAYPQGICIGPTGNDPSKANYQVDFSGWDNSPDYHKETYLVPGIEHALVPRRIYLKETHARSVDIWGYDNQ